MSDIPAWLQRYIDRGFRLVFYPTKRKGPIGNEWQKHAADPADYQPGDNVGVVDGIEISPGRFLVDIDFDSEESSGLAKFFLPDTSFAFGRDSKKVTHAFYTTDKPQITKVFDDNLGKRIIELRGLSKDGDPGMQTMVPPSVHPSGEIVTLRSDGEIGHAPDIERRITLLSIACLLLKQFGDRGFGHDARMCVAGFLLKRGLEKEEVLKIGIALATATGNNVHDVETTVYTTHSRIAQGERVMGSGALEKTIGDEGKKVTALIKRWLGVKDFLTNKDGAIIANKEYNIKTALENLGVWVGFDEFAQRAKVKYNGFDGTLQDRHRNRIWLDIDAQFNFMPTAEKFDIVLMDAAYHNKLHPVREYLDSLKWDGVPRMDRWLIEYGGAADTEYVRAVTGLFMISAVRRVRQPGCKVDEILVLESPQGKGKSSAIRALCPNEEWFTDDFPMNIDSKEIIERTLGKWIIECAELAGARKAQAEHIKSMISRQTDGPVRMAYGRLPIEQPRQFVIFGTTNSTAYLKDETGSRRFWPVRVKSFNLAKVKEFRDQLWAEANVREAAGESNRLDPSLYEMAGFQQERRRIEDPWETIIDIQYSQEKKHRIVADFIWELLGIPVERRTEQHQERITKTMQRLNFRKGSVRDEQGNVVRGWLRDPNTGNGELEFDK
jgi:predicted P-loop ATPase